MTDETKPGPAQSHHLQELEKLLVSVREIIAECKDDFNICPKCGHQDDDATKNSDFLTLIKGSLRETEASLDQAALGTAGAVEADKCPKCNGLGANPQTGLDCLDCFGSGDIIDADGLSAPSRAAPEPRCKVIPGHHLCTDSCAQVGECLHAPKAAALDPVASTDTTAVETAGARTPSPLCPIR